MRKNNLIHMVFTLALCFALSACAKASGPVSKGDSALFEEMVRANSIDEVLLRHDTLTMERKSLDQGKEVVRENWYINKDEIYTENSNGYASDASDDKSLLVRSFDSSVITYLPSDPGIFKEWFENYKKDFSLVVSPEEVLTKTGEIDDRFHAETLISSEEIVRTLMAEYKDTYGGIDYTSGMKLKFTYEFDLVTRDLLCVAVCYVDEQGKETLYINDVFSYETVDFEPVKNSGPLAAAFDDNKLRTVKVTFGTGTDKPVTGEYRIAKDMALVGYHNEAAVTEFFTDEACTKPYKTDDDSVTQLYAK